MSEKLAKFNSTSLRMPSLEDCLFLDLYHRESSASAVMTAHGLSRRIEVFPVKGFKDSDVQTRIGVYLKEWRLSTVFILSQAMSKDALNLMKLCLKSHPKTYLICLELSGQDSLSMLRILSDGGVTLSLDEFLELTRRYRAGSY